MYVVNKKMPHTWTFIKTVCYNVVSTSICKAKIYFTLQKAVCLLEQGPFAHTVIDNRCQLVAERRNALFYWWGPSLWMGWWIGSIGNNLKRPWLGTQKHIPVKTLLTLQSHFPEHLSPEALAEAPLTFESFLQSFGKGGKNSIEN